MAGFPPKPAGTHMSRRGKRDAPRHLASWKDSEAAQQPRLRGQTRREGIPIPDADERWLPEVQSWFRSFKLSGQSSFFEASDWSTLVAAARAYDMSIRTGSPGWFGNFVRLSERLGATIGDRKRIKMDLDGPGEPLDSDEEAADAEVISWQKRLEQRRSRDDGA
jgi:hypothetical protein